MKEKTNIFVKFKNSLHNINEFPKYMREGLGRAIFYAFVLTLFFGIGKGIFAGININKAVDEVVTTLNKDEYQFSIENSELNISTSPIKFEESNTLIYIDKDISIADSESLKSMTVNADEYFLVLKDGIVISGNSSGLGEIGFTYEEFGIENNVDNQSVINEIKSYATPVTVVACIFLIVSTFVSYLFNALVFAILSIISSKILRVNLKFGELYSLVIYTATFPTLIVLILNIIVPNVLFTTAGSIGTILYTYIVLRSMQGENNDNISLQ